MARGAIAYKGQLYLGGSKVEANPTGSATGGNLSKLGVDDTVYAIPQVNNGILTIQKSGETVATFSANQSENVTANIDVSEDVAGTQTVSGNPITLTDCAQINAESLVVEFEPKQNLHGQDYPYVGGAGKNKLPMTVESIKSKNTAGTWNNNVYTKNNMSFEILTDGANNVTGIKVNGTKNISSPVYFTIGTFDFATNESYKVNGGVDLPSPIPVYFAVNDGVTVVSSADYTQTFTSDTTKDVIIVVERTQQISNVIFHPMIRLATETDPTFAPYSNICPITGYDEVEVDDVGKNICSPNFNDWTVAQAYLYLKIPHFDNSIYTMSFVDKDTSVDLSDISMGFMNNYPEGDSTEYRWVILNGVVQDNKTNVSLAHGINCDTIIIYRPTEAVFNKLFQRFYIQVEEGSTATAYESYHSSNATIQFGQTVYGGKSNFTDGGTDDEIAFIKDTNITNISEGSDGNADWLNVVFTIDIDILLSDTVEHRQILASRSMSNYSGDWEYENVNGHVHFYSGSMAIYAFYPKSVFPTLSDFTTYYANNKAEFAIPYETVSTIATPPTDLKLLKGTNNITTNGTTITLGYQPDNVIGEAIKASEEYTDRRMDALGDLAYIDEDGDNSTKFLRGDGTWQNTPEGVTALDDLTDTAISSPSNGQILKYNGSKWVNSADYSLPKASASTLGGVKVGANLSIDADGVLSATGGGGANALNDLTDVSAASPSNKQVLAYDSSQSKWVAVDADVVAIPRSYWSSTTRELDFMITVPAYNTQRILKFSLMHNAGLAASEYMLVLDRGSVYSSKLAGDTCAISSSYLSSTNTYTITISMPAVSGGQNFVFAMTMYNGSGKTW